MVSHYMLLVPMEIFEAVIDQASDDTCSLRHLSLTCRAFLPRAQYHLFNTIVLNSPQRMASFGEFLDTHPWAGPLVRKLVHSTFIPIRDSADPTASVLDVVPFHFLSRLPNLCTWAMGAIETEHGLNAGAWLSYRASVISCYQGYGSHIRNLEVAYVSLENTSDFIELVSAFTGIHTLTCSHISINETEQSIAAQGSETDVCGRLARLRSLNLSTSVDIRVVEFLLKWSRTTLNNLILTFEPYFYQSYERLETLVSSLPQLSSISLVIPSAGITWEHGGDLLPNIGFATRLVGSIQSIHVQDMRVEFRPDSVGSLGCCLSSGPRPLSVCGALEDALLAFPRPRILLHDSVTMRRAGRWEFWSAAIKRAFRRMSERGFLCFPDYKSNSPDPVGHEAAVKCLVTSLYGNSIVTASPDGTIIVWDAERGTVSQEWFAHQRGVHALALSSDGRRLVSAGGDGTLVVWDISNGVHEAVLTERRAHLLAACAWSPDGALIALALSDKTVRVQDARTFEQRDMLEYQGFDGIDEPLRFSPDSRYLAWRTQRHGSMLGCRIWRPTSGEQPKELLAPSPLHSSMYVAALSLDPQSTRIATAHGSLDSEENVVWIWDIATGTALAKLAGHKGVLTDVSFSPDGGSILSASFDGSAKIWDAKDGREKVSLQVGGPPYIVPKACFSPDGKYVAAASQGGKVRLWRAANGTLVAEFCEHMVDVVDVVFSSGGEFLVSGDLSGVVCVRRWSAFMGH